MTRARIGFSCQHTPCVGCGNISTNIQIPHKEKEDAYMCEDCQNKRRREGHCKKMLPPDAFDRGPNRHPNLKDHDPVALCDQCERKPKKKTLSDTMPLPAYFVCTGSANLQRWLPFAFCAISACRPRYSNAVEMHHGNMMLHRSATRLDVHEPLMPTTRLALLL